MGVTVREKDGAWWVFISHQNKRKARRVGTGEPGKRAAYQAAEKIQAKLVLGDLSVLAPRQVAKPAPNFQDVAAGWEQVIGPDLKRGTRLTYACAIHARLNPAFGILPMTDVTEERVEAWWVKLRTEGLSKKTLGNLRSILRAICRRAVSLKLLSSNPVDRIEGRLGRAQGEIKKTSDYLTAEDLTTFLATAERVCPAEYPILLIMATGGLRVGEALGLQVGDLDGMNSQITIRRSVRRGYVDSPKSGKAGVVDVPPITMAVLQRVRDIRKVEAAVAGTEPRWLFPSRVRTDTPLTPEAVGLAMRKVLLAAGIRRIRVHDLRHSYATLAIQAGVPILNVSRQLRHASIAITADVYAHAVPGGNRVAADVMEAILAGSGGNHTQPPRNSTT
jgi:integrase